MFPLSRLRRSTSHHRNGQMPDQGSILQHMLESRNKGNATGPYLRGYIRQRSEAAGLQALLTSLYGDPLGPCRFFLSCKFPCKLSCISCGVRGSLDGRSGCWQCARLERSAQRSIHCDCPASGDGGCSWPDPNASSSSRASILCGRIASALRFAVAPQGRSTSGWTDSPPR